MRTGTLNTLAWVAVGVIIGFAFAIIGIGYGFITITGAAGCI
jgi:hypothetical protein